MLKRLFELKSSTCIAVKRSLLEEQIENDCTLTARQASNIADILMPRLGVLRLTQADAVMDQNGFAIPN